VLAVLPLLIASRFGSNHGSGFEEAFEEAQCPQALDA
jgi:hypothetical protein